jgi:hypothetical protein
MQSTMFSKGPRTQVAALKTTLSLYSQGHIQHVDRPQGGKFLPQEGKQMIIQVNNIQCLCNNLSIAPDMEVAGSRH